MVKTLFMKLKRIQPSQLFISSAKLSEVMKSFNSESIEPVPVKKIGEDVVLVDGHTRAFAVFLSGVSEVPVYWETDELDWHAYKVCVEWCKNEGINTVADLKSRVLPHERYNVLWLKRCERMQRELEARGKRQPGNGPRAKTARG